MKMCDVGEWTRELIICLLNVLKCDFVHVYEAMFNDVERPLEQFFYILCIQKSHLDEVVELMFQIDEWPLRLINCLLYVLKKDLDEGD
jgi:hypothetical protein